MQSRHLRTGDTTIMTVFEELDIYGELLADLTRVGSLASRLKLFNEAQIIFTGLQAVLPDNVDVMICNAAFRLDAQHPQDAIAILRDQALPLDPQNATVKCFLAKALRHSGNHAEGDKILQEVLSTVSANSEEHTLAIEILHESDSDRHEHVVGF